MALPTDSDPFLPMCRFEFPTPVDLGDPLQKPMMVKEQMLPFLTTNSGHCMSAQESNETNSVFGFNSTMPGSQKNSTMPGLQRFNNGSRNITAPRGGQEVDQSVKQKRPPVGAKKQTAVPNELSVLLGITEALWEFCECKPVVPRPPCTRPSKLPCTESPKRPSAVEATSKPKQNALVQQKAAVQQNAVVHPVPADCTLPLQRSSPSARVVTREQFLEMRRHIGVITPGSTEQLTMPHLQAAPLLWQKDAPKQTEKKKAGEVKKSAEMNCIATLEQSTIFIESDTECIEDELIQKV